MKTLFLTTLITVGLLSFSLQTLAQTTVKPDADFVQKAAAGGLLEVDLGKLALKKADSQKVKDFAKMMVDDHSKVNDELAKLAKSKKLEIPNRSGSAKKMIADSLNSQSGKGFDMLYMNMMITSHEQTIGLFQDESMSGKDAELKRWAAGKIPALKHHLQMAKTLFKTTKN